MVVLHHCTSHSHTLGYVGSSDSVSSHKHEDFKDVHHQHDFHVGIFHFLGHLFEGIDHSNDIPDEHFIVGQKTITKEVIDHSKPKNPYYFGNKLLVVEVDAESLPDPPYHLSLLPKLKLPGNPLRAPPILV
jgi:hypothetical protein